MPRDSQATENAASNALPGSSGESSVLLRTGEGEPSTLSTTPWADADGNPALAGLPLQLDVLIPIPNFRVRDLVTLEKGTVLGSDWPYADDVPVYCGGEQLVWAEFEVVDDVLSVRVTRVL